MGQCRDPSPTSHITPSFPLTELQRRPCLSAWLLLAFWRSVFFAHFSSLLTSSLSPVLSSASFSDSFVYSVIFLCLEMTNTGSLSSAACMQETLYLHCSDSSQLAYSSCWNAQAGLCAKLLKFTAIFSETEPGRFNHRTVTVIGYRDQFNKRYL